MQAAAMSKVHGNEPGNAVPEKRRTADAWLPPICEQDSNAHHLARSVVFCKARDATSRRLTT